MSYQGKIEANLIYDDRYGPSDGLLVSDAIVESAPCHSARRALTRLFSAVAEGVAVSVDCRRTAKMSVKNI